MIRISSRFPCVSMLALTTALALAAPAMAQTESAPAAQPDRPTTAPAQTPAAQAEAAPATADDGSLAEIVVTAQRRGQNLQDTPLTVSALTGDLAAQKGVTSTSDLQIATPGLVFADSGVGPALYLRGIGTQNTAGGDEGSISTYVDGVYYSNLPSAFSSLSNVERVEVLKGPQGTLFGRNATGGLINIITKDPSFNGALNASVTVATYDTIGGDLYVTGPLGEGVAANFSAFYNKQADGWGINRTNGRDVYDGEQYAMRGKLLFDLSDRTRILLNGDYSFRTDSNTSGAVDEGAVGPGGNAGLRDFYDLEASLQPLDRNRTGGGSLKIEHDLSFGRVTSTSAYRFNNLRSQFDNDRSARVIADGTFRTNDKQFSQELQIQSLPGSDISWIGGLYYLNNKTNLREFRLTGIAFTALGGSVNTPARQVTDSYAVYAQTTVPLGEATNVTAGLRYTIDEREISSTTFLGNGAVVPGRDQDSRYKKLTYRFAIDHHVTDDVMLFASVNRGFKSGVFNLYSPSAATTRPEVLDAYEVGVKSELFDRRVRLNVSPFLYKYKDIQLVQASLTGTRLLNAARATLKGVDADLTAIVAPGLTFDVSAEYLDAEYDSFQNAPATVPRPATCTPVPTQLPGARTGGNLSCIIDASGNQLIRAPKFSGSIGASYRFVTSAGAFRINANLFHSASFPYEPDGRLRQKSYEVLNAQIAWRTPSDRYGVTIFGRNLLDQEYYVNRIGAGGGDTHSSAAPLTAGVTFDVKL